MNKFSNVAKVTIVTPQNLIGKTTSLDFKNYDATISNERKNYSSYKFNFAIEVSNNKKGIKPYLLQIDFQRQIIKICKKGQLKNALPFDDIDGAKKNIITASDQPMISPRLQTTKSKLPTLKNTTFLGALTPTTTRRNSSYNSSSSSSSNNNDDDDEFQLTSELQVKNKKLEIYLHAQPNIELITQSNASCDFLVEILQNISKINKYFEKMKITEIMCGVVEKRGKVQWSTRFAVLLMIQSDTISKIVKKFMNENSNFKFKNNNNNENNDNDDVPNLDQIPYLICYKANNNTLLPVNVIDLWESTIEKSGDFGFRIDTNFRQFQFKTNSIEITESWIENISNSIKNSFNHNYETDPRKRRRFDMYPLKFIDLHSTFKNNNFKQIDLKTYYSNDKNKSNDEWKSINSRPQLSTKNNDLSKDSKRFTLGSSRLTK
eukprot:TRINITY_DN467_c6_g1_i1.p1 TRINITY_DN467_c6_g1~~TRINITY_DN467_c6_g1_i1.p1  ORF type:complete len:433 (-),score=113.81 TRINITY_DN467_c6_g1_i1:18-1316(-)